MSRWLALFVGGAVAALSAGCGSATVLGGLTNAPRLGGSTTADDRMHDVVANGDDGCGTFAEHGVLRNRIPQCPAPGRTRVGAGSAYENAASVSSFARREHGSAESLVEPWLDHFYAGGPCSPSSGTVTRRALLMSGPTEATRVVAWAPGSPAGPVCLH